VDSKRPLARAEAMRGGDFDLNATTPTCAQARNQSPWWCFPF